MSLVAEYNGDFSSRAHFAKQVCTRSLARLSYLFECITGCRRMSSVEMKGSGGRGWKFLNLESSVHFRGITIEAHSVGKSIQCQFRYKRSSFTFRQTYCTYVLLRPILFEYERTYFTMQYCGHCKNQKITFVIFKYFKFLNILLLFFNR